MKIYRENTNVFKIGEKKTSGTLHGDISALHRVDSDVLSAATDTTHCFQWQRL
jgi:hypothetical protein